jgi:hypothetical protein
MNSEKRNCISKLRGMKNIVLREYGRKIETPRLFFSLLVMHYSSIFSLMQDMTDPRHSPHNKPSRRPNA